MTKVIDQLQIDHDNMRQLLRILEKEIDVYRSGGIPDFDLMKQIIEYALNYPTLIHHPREDPLFRRLLVRDPTSESAIGDLIGEHAELAQLTQRFAAALHNVTQDVELPRAWFDTLARDYIAMMRHHMDAEEERFFPRLRETLQDSDWAEFDARMASGNDPLFGSSIEGHYASLHRRILQTGS
jgi:hemerythrin-like domain-containing protein